MNRRKARPGGADTPPEAPTSAAYQATRDTIVPVDGRQAHDVPAIVSWYAPVEVDARTLDVLAAIADVACPTGSAIIPLRQLAIRTARSVGAVRSALIRLETAKALVVRTAPRRPDGRLGTNGYQITVGPWAALWKPPGVTRAGPHETRERRSAGLDDRADELAEGRIRSALCGNDRAQGPRAGDTDTARRDRAQGPRARSTSSTSKGGASKSAPPPVRPRDFTGHDLPDPEPEAFKLNLEAARARLRESGSA